ncbi:hypothetical protein Gotur_014985 [Gossypium turneri]
MPMFVPCFSYVKICDMMQSFEGQIRVASSDSVLDTYVHALLILKCLVLSFSMHMFVPCFSYVKILKDGSGFCVVIVLTKFRRTMPGSRLEKDEGPPHEKKFVSAVKIPTEDGIFYITGDKKSRVKEAENSAASCLIQSLKEMRYL